MTSYIRTAYTLDSHQRPIVGDTKTSAQIDDHIGWLNCDGRALSTSEFFFLFRVIGYSFGGSGDTFNLPDARGKVPGFNGPYTDFNTNSDNFVFGSTRGEYEHKLTIPEMPSHNHGVANRVQDISNNMTSLEYTGITVDLSGTGIYDSGHTHGYTASNSDNHQNANALGITSSDNNSGTYGATTDTGNANLVDPRHRHGITDPRHAHRLNPAGGDQYHNNIQPTIVIGNIFMYCGKPNYPRFAVPFQSMTIIL